MPEFAALACRRRMPHVRLVYESRAEPDRVLRLWQQGQHVAQQVERDEDLRARLALRPHPHWAAHTDGRAHAARGAQGEVQRLAGGAPRGALEERPEVAHGLRARHDRAPLGAGRRRRLWGRRLWGRRLWGRRLWGRRLWGRRLWSRRLWGWLWGWLWGEQIGEAPVGPGAGQAAAGSVHEDGAREGARGQEREERVGRGGGRGAACAACAADAAHGEEEEAEEEAEEETEEEETKQGRREERRKT
jgi:hypothetical protein